jgi:hypothetical protein
LVIRLVLAAAVTMATVHKQMHQWTGQERKPNEGTQYMGAMLREQQRTGDHGKSEKDDSSAELRRRHPWSVTLPSKMVLRRHTRLP